MLIVPFSVFTEFLCSQSHERFAVVRKFASWGEYSREKDPYLLLKQAVRKSAKNGTPLDVEVVLDNTDHQFKHDSYPTLTANFESWRKRHSRTFLDPVNAVWKSGHLTVNVKPDLAFETKGVRYLTFIHWKKNLTITKSAADCALHIPAEAYEKKGLVGYRYCFLDLWAPKLYTLGNVKSGMNPLLHNEAASFLTIYNNQDQAA